jgi:hypothetical protein
MMRLEAAEVESRGGGTVPVKTVAGDSPVIMVATVHDGSP